MNKKKTILFSLFLAFPIIIPQILLISTLDNNLFKENISLLADDGVSKYSTPQSVTYEMEINFTLTHKYGPPQGYAFNVARYETRKPNSILMPYTPPYQEVEVLYNSTSSNFDSYAWNVRDKFNNTYDGFNITSLGIDNSVTIDTKYEFKLNEVSFGDISDSDIGDYNMSDIIFDLYCNNSELYYNISDPDLINAANNDCDINGGDNPIEKAEKIYNFVCEYLTYEIDESDPKEKGASWAYDNEKGDCSEYSTLMITLLRIHKIPARKIVGIVMSQNATLRPFIGDDWEFKAEYRGGGGGGITGSSSFLGHAWIEYYVPDIGWIACDPTWGEDGTFDYFNRIDYLHLATNIGAWYGNTIFLDESEYPFLPNPAAGDLTAYDYDVTAKITVIDTDLVPLEEDIPWLLIILVIGILIGIVVVIVIVIKKARSRD